MANVRSYLFYLDLFACSNFVLFAAGFYDRVHISPFNESAGKKGPPDSPAKNAQSLAVYHEKGYGATNSLRGLGNAVWSHSGQTALLAPFYNLGSLPEPAVQPITPTSLASSPDPIQLMAAEMKEVDAVIQRRLASDVALINQISHYIISAGGKRIRPMLVLLFANALGFHGKERFELAAIVEFIHTATLLHDDVVDESALRRGRETANALFGNAASVLVGDFLYSRAFQMMVSVDRLRVLDVLADATNVIAEGEVLQLMNMHDPDLAVDDYLKVIRFKTAKLFEASARLGAVLANANESVEDACASYGRSLGTAFQLVDDLLDYEGSTSQLGKNVGDDLREGKPTLPLLIAMERANAADRLLIRSAIEHGEVSRLDEIVGIVRRTGALEATRDAARTEADKARSSLSALPATVHREALLEFCVRSVERSS
ncbi:MAG: polyprenyl synthetase family protein [Rhizobacter sp.]